MPHEDLPIVCSLEAADLARRVAQLRGGVLKEATSFERLPNGYRWRFPHRPDRLTRIGTVMDAERQCCRFLNVSIVAEADLGQVTVEITGPAGTADFIQQWLDELRAKGTAAPPPNR